MGTDAKPVLLLSIDERLKLEKVPCAPRVAKDRVARITANDGPRQSPRRWGRSLSTVVTTVWLLLASLCFWQGLPALTGSSRQATASATSQSGERELLTTPIEEIAPLQRVIAANPELAGETVSERQIDPATDRLVSFKLTHPDGSFVEWTRVESIPELLDELLLDDEIAFGTLSDGAIDDVLAQRLMGRTLDVELIEFGASGPATIVGIAHCPEPEADDGTGRRLVRSVTRRTPGGGGERQPRTGRPRPRRMG